MRLGFLTSYSKENIELARKLKFDSVELALGWNADSKKLGEFEANLPEAKEVLAKTGITVSAVACYGNPFMFGANEISKIVEKAAFIAKALGTDIIATMTGREGSKNIKDNMPLVKEKWGAGAKAAENSGVRIAFEPWPGGITGHGPYNHTNLASTPALWSMIFNEVNSPVMGLEYDPSHLIWQQIDYIQAIKDFKDRIFHMHAKDTLIDAGKLKKCGVHGAGWWRFTIPGEGNVDWKKVFETLKTVGYKGDIAIEHEDANYMEEKKSLGLEKGRDFLCQYVKFQQAKDEKRNHRR